MKRTGIHILLTIFVLLAASCRKDEIVLEEPVWAEKPGEGKETPGKAQDAPVFPAAMQSLAKVYVDTPGKVGVNSKHRWVSLCRIRIVGEQETVLFEADSLQVKGRGNTTWYSYPKKPFTLKLNHQADFFGTGKSKHYVLLANWMDRTLLRNAVAFEAARRTSLEWTPTGRFVELYLNGKHQGNYWLGEKINEEGSKFKADFLFTFDTSDEAERDFYTPYGYRPNTWEDGLPVEVKHPDRDDYEGNGFQAVLDMSKAELERLGKAIREGNYAGLVDLDSFCDWYLVHEVTGNMEPNHPKSCFIHLRDGKFHAGPVWDFDWYTLIPGVKGLKISNSLYYRDLMKDPAFKARLKERWETLKPEFKSIPEYIDTEAVRIRISAENDKQMWPCWSTVNGDESMSFPDAVNRLKQAWNQRIDQVDRAVGKL